MPYCGCYDTSWFELSFLFLYYFIGNCIGCLLTTGVDFPQMALLELLKGIRVHYDSIIGCYFERLAPEEALKIAYQVATTLNNSAEIPSNAFIPEILLTAQEVSAQFIYRN